MCKLERKFILIATGSLLLQCPGTSWHAPLFCRLKLLHTVGGRVLLSTHISISIILSHQLTKINFYDKSKDFPIFRWMKQNDQLKCHFHAHSLTVGLNVHILLLAPWDLLNFPVSHTYFPDFSHRENGHKENEKGHSGNNSSLPVINLFHPQYRFSAIKNQRICPEWCLIGRTSMNNF